uniref:APAF-1 helical domain-containing protein n=1 Tax=Clastoptera arizonana TaxID=38151 RepID=A0A1B6CRK5_9HEMI
MYSYFPKLYLENLEFIEAKLRAVGPADLLSDYKKYREYITEKWDLKNMDKIRDFEWFVEWAGQSIKRLDHVDIVQFALQEHQKSYVYKAALDLARKRDKNKYIMFPFGAPESRVAPQLIHYKENMTAVSFSDVKNNIIVAGESGCIQIVDSQGIVLRTFEGHNKKVTHLSLSANGQYFLSSSEDCTVKVWKIVDLNSYTNGVFTNGCGFNKTPSPQQRQKNFSDLWKVEKTGEKCLYRLAHNGIVTCAEFSPDSKTIVSVSHDKIMRIWNFEKEEVISIFNLNGVPYSCMFSNCGSFVFYSGDKCTVEAYDIRNKNRIASYISPHPVKSLHTISGGNEMEVVLQTNTSVSLQAICSSDNIKANNKVTLFENFSRKEFDQYLCCAVPQDGSYIAVAVSNNKILVCEPHGQIIREYHEPSGNPVCLAADSRSNHLLGIYSDQIIRLWKVEVKPGELPTTLNTNFHAIWSEGESPFIAVLTNRNSVKLLKGRKTINSYSFEKREVSICCLAPDRSCVICGCRDGSLWKWEGNEITHILNLSSDVCAIKSYKITSESIIVALSSQGQVKVCFDDTKIQTINLNCRDCVDFFLLSSDRLLIVCRDFCIKMFVIKSGEPECPFIVIHLPLLVGDLYACDLSCHNILAAVDYKRSLLHLQEVTAKSTPKLINVPQSPTTCKYSPGGEDLVVGFNYGSIKIFSIGEEQFIKEVKINLSPIQSISIGIEGIIGVVCKHIVALIPPESEQIARVQLSAKHICCSPDGKKFVTINTEGNIHLLKLLDNGKKISETRLMLDLHL